VTRIVNKSEIRMPSDVLELRAVEQRRRLHDALADLRATVAERADVNRVAREHVWPASGLAAVLGLLLGYGIGGIFVP
jgi:hypothetical protein